MVFRIIFIGDKACGKSSIIRRYCENDFTTIYSPSLTIERYDRIKICSSDIFVDLQLWDTSSIWHDNIIKQYFAGMHCVVIIFDVNDEGACANIKKWHNLIVNFVIDSNISNPEIFVVGNKIDNRERHLKDNVAFIKQITNNPYIEVSAKTGNGISKLFHEISYRLIKMHPESFKEKNLFRCAFCLCCIL
ncbi:MAG: ras-related protein Rab-28-like protein [Harvfovirus sp.]|uniref:Ras-related protein Rab-28-like protein n=1 Tax=Harvfovirus sp. TaxID=2487768 RepID=A0A3G5A0I4_9VIRU|nr:MAG: ras-related protein Rab-28-like protein [Harvfovirus sp.]